MERFLAKLNYFFPDFFFFFQKSPNRFVSNNKNFPILLDKRIFFTNWNECDIKILSSFPISNYKFQSIQTTYQTTYFSFSGRGIQIWWIVFHFFSIFFLPTLHSQKFSTNVKKKFFKCLRKNDCLYTANAIPNLITYVCNNENDNAI